MSGTQTTSSSGTGAPTIVGVCGAGTMGRGIAQMAATYGAETILYDAFQDGLGKGVEGLTSGVRKFQEKGKLSAEDADAAIARVKPTTDLADLRDAQLIIEAAPENIEIKHDLFGKLSEIVAGDCVLASNTSSLWVTEIAAGATNPERVVGMHFFNPAPLMRLVEIVAGERSDEGSLALARACGEAMGKSVIDAKDVPGFLVNRTARPFLLESLRLVEEQIGPVEQVDRIVRLEGGFRMGAIEVSDLVGVDVGYEVSKSFYDLSFYEPRWKPSIIQTRMVAAGKHGRKTKLGYYDYSGESHRPADPEPPAEGGGDGMVVISGDYTIAHELRAAAAAAGWSVATPAEAEDGDPWLIVDCGIDPDDPPLQGAPQAVLCAEGSLAALDPEGSAIGFHVLPPLEHAKLVELTRSPTTSDTAAERAERFFSTLGKLTEYVGDAPGLVLGRIVCQIINEAAFSLGDGHASAEDLDTGMVLALNHPRGPIEWADTIGLDHVLAVLDGLSDHYREDRYRPAHALRQAVYHGHLGRSVGRGFHTYGNSGVNPPHSAHRVPRNAVG